MRKMMLSIALVSLLLICLSGSSSCYALGSQLELEWDFLTPFENDRSLNTVSLHILDKFSETKNKSVYRGITITRPRGNVTLEPNQQPRDSSAIGIGPVYVLQNKFYSSGKLSAVFDVSGGIILYNKAFPAGGRSYNFMWRVGPQFIYKFRENSSVNIGYTFMHVSNGFRSSNPGYDAHGLSLGLVTVF